MNTLVKNASVKVMLSYDYSHFEASMSLENEGGLLMSEIDEARKSCQRLADKAISQYRKAKQMAANRTDGEFKIQNFENQCKKIMQKPEGERTVNEVAMLKRYHDENWRDEFDYRYNYEDDDDDMPF